MHHGALMLMAQGYYIMLSLYEGGVLSLASCLPWHDSHLCLAQCLPPSLRAIQL